MSWYERTRRLVTALALTALVATTLLAGGAGGAELVGDGTAGQELVHLGTLPGGDLDPRDAVDNVADTLDEEAAAAQCEAWRVLWPGNGDCPLRPEAEYRCVVWGETTSVEHAEDGLGYTLAGELECREDGRTFRTLHGTFRTGPGLVTRDCRNPWCDDSDLVYSLYASMHHEPRCAYEFTGSDGPYTDGGNVYERSAASSTDDPRLELFVELDGQTVPFRAEDFEVANGDGLGINATVPAATSSFWVLDDGDPDNGWSEGLAMDWHIVMNEHRVDPTAPGVPANCLPTDELTGFTVEGKLEFEINEYSLFRPPSER